MNENLKIGGYRKLLLLACSLFGSAFAETVSYPNGCTGERLCSSVAIDEKQCCTYNWHLDIGLLYEQLSVDGMNAGALYTPSVTFVNDEADSINFSSQEIGELNPCFDYALGLTASGGFFSCHDDWYVGVNFDWISVSQDFLYDVLDSARGVYLPNSNFKEVLYSGIPINFFPFKKIAYEASMDMYQIDLILRKGYFYSLNFSFDQLVGLKALWFNTFQNESFFINIVAVGNLDLYFSWGDQSNSWGVGPLYGFNSSYRLSSSCFLFLDGDVALLVGKSDKMDISRVESVDNETQLTGLKNGIKVFDDIGCQFFVPVRAILGLQYKRLCAQDNQCLSVKLGYDVRGVISYPVLDRGFSANGLYANLAWNF